MIDVNEILVTYGFWLRLLLAAVLFALAGLGAKLFRKWTGLLERQMERFKPEWLKILGRGFNEPLVLMLRAVLLFAAFWALPLPFPMPTVLAYTAPLLRAIIVCLIAWGFWRAAPLCRLLLRSAENQLDMETNKTMGRFFENIYRALVAVFAVLIVLDLFGVPVTGLVTGAGIAGLAVSLAAQSTLSNLIAGITLVLERPFGIGDYVLLGDIEGTVEDVSFRSTRLRSPDNVLISVENSKICAEYIQNVTSRTSRLWTFTISLPYSTAPKTVAQVTADLEAMLKADRDVKPETVQIVLDSFADSYLALNVRLYVTALGLGDFRAMKNRLNLAIMAIMEQNGCSFAFPSTSVYLENTDPPQK